VTGEGTGAVEQSAGGFGLRANPPQRRASARAIPPAATTNKEQAMSDQSTKEQVAGLGAGQTGMAAGGAGGAAAGGVLGWGVGMTSGTLVGLIVGMFLGLAVAKSRDK
jgi:hypothetical protein